MYMCIYICVCVCIFPGRVSECVSIFKKKINCNILEFFYKAFMEFLYVNQFVMHDLLLDMLMRKL